MERMLRLPLCWWLALASLIPGLACGGSAGKGASVDAGSNDGPASDGPSPRDAPAAADDGGVDAGPLPPLTGICVDNGWCWERPLPQGSTLVAAWAAATDDVWAVGSDGIIMHWDGRTWTSRRIPGVSDDFGTVWGSGPQDVWVGGGSGMTYHWNGTAFAPAPGPYEATGISGTGPRDIWAVMNLTSAVTHYDGSAWAQTALPGQNFGCSNVLAMGARDVWFACSKLFHFDGTTTTPSDMAVHGLAGSGPSDVWAIDDGQDSDVWRWDGQQWSKMGTTAVDDGLAAIWVRSPSDVWGVGNYGSFHHYDGTRWTQIDARDDANRFFLIGAGPSDLWAGGETGLVMRRRGGSWTAMTEMTPDISPVKSVWAASRSDAWAATSDGMLRKNAAAWTPVPGTSGKPYVDVWGSGPDDVWLVVGPTQGGAVAGSVERWNGSAITSVTGPLAKQEAGLLITGSAADSVWVAGSAGFHHWDGTQWTTVAYSTTTTDPIIDIFTTGPSDLWAVNRAGAVLRWNGSTWTATSRASTPLQTIWGTSPNDVWIGGDSGVQHWDGSTWKGFSLSPSISVSNKTIYAVGGSGPADAWAIMPGAYAFHWDGSAWSERSARLFGIFSSISVSADGAVFLGGNGPLILRHGP
jgi:hypothetical protein